MEVLVWIVIGVVVMMLIASLAAIRRAAVTFIMPVMIVLVGAIWIYAALEHYQRATARERTGLIGYHYSMPEWGFEYAPDGPRMEWWSFEVPAYTTLALLLTSAVTASVTKWRQLRAWGIVGLWVHHFGCAVAFLLVYAFLWVDAASVFI
jgi:hypothetical protein